MAPRLRLRAEATRCRLATPVEVMEGADPRWLKSDRFVIAAQQMRQQVGTVVVTDVGVRVDTAVVDFAHEVVYL